MAVSGRAQVSSSEGDDLHDRLAAARAEFARIQVKADSVGDQMASIDAVDRRTGGRGCRGAGCITRARGHHPGEDRSPRTRRGSQGAAQRTITVAYRRSRSVAVQERPTAELEVLLCADSIEELSSVMEYSSAATASGIQTMVKNQRLRAELNADKAELEVTLADLVEAKEGQERLARHLKGTSKGPGRQTRQASRSHQSLKGRGRCYSGPQRGVRATARRERSCVRSCSVGGGFRFAWPINGPSRRDLDRAGVERTQVSISTVSPAIPIRASKAGSVVSATYDGGYKHHIVLDHGGGFASLHAHASGLCVGGGRSRRRAT